MFKSFTIKASLICFINLQFNNVLAIELNYNNDEELLQMFESTKTPVLRKTTNFNAKNITAENINDNFNLDVDTSDYLTSSYLLEYIWSADDPNGILNTFVEYNYDEYSELLPENFIKNSYVNVDASTSDIKADNSYINILDDITNSEDNLSMDITNSIVNFDDESTTTNSKFSNSLIMGTMQGDILEANESIINANLSNFKTITLNNTASFQNLNAINEINAIDSNFIGNLTNINFISANNSNFSGELTNINSINANNSIFNIDITKSTFTPLSTQRHISGANNTLRFLNIIDSNKNINYSIFTDNFLLANFTKDSTDTTHPAANEDFFNNFVASNGLIDLNINLDYIGVENTNDYLKYFIKIPKISIPSTVIADNAIKKIPSTALVPANKITNPNENTENEIPNSNSNEKTSIPSMVIADNAIKKIPSTTLVPANKITNPNENTENEIPNSNSNEKTSIPSMVIADNAIKKIPSITLTPAINNNETQSNTSDNLDEAYDLETDDYMNNDIDDYFIEEGMKITLSYDELLELSKLSDEELIQLGLSRSEIEEKMKEERAQISENIITKISLNDTTSLKLDELNAFLGLNFYDFNNLSKRAANLKNYSNLNGVWVKGSGTRINYDKKFAFKNNDFYVGADKLNNFKDFDLYLGAFLNASYKYSSTKDFIKQKGFGAGLYATLLSGNFYIDSIIGYTNAKNELNDNVMGKLNARNNLYKISLDSGYRFGDRYYFEPSIKLNLAYSDKIKLKNNILAINKNGDFYANIEARMRFGAYINDYINQSLGFGYSYDLTKINNLDININSINFIKKQQKDKKILVDFGTKFNVSKNLSILFDYEQSFNGIYNITHNINAQALYTF